METKYKDENEEEKTSDSIKRKELETPLKKKLPKKFTTVTKVSKIIALALFVTLPFTGFYLGTKYQSAINKNSQPPNAITNYNSQSTPGSNKGEDDPLPKITYSIVDNLIATTGNISNNPVKELAPEDPSKEFKYYFNSDEEIPILDSEGKPALTKGFHVDDSQLKDMQQYTSSNVISITGWLYWKDDVNLPIIRPFHVHVVTDQEFLNRP